MYATLRIGTFFQTEARATLMGDFTQIRSLSGGQRLAFEELVCQLARRENVAVGSVFRRVEGSGGDGGVEAYWLLTDGTKFGYQAKFFTRAGEIDWSQIDESVEQALKTHTTLTKYFVALACDLTDRRGAKGKGQTGWQLWDTHKTKWQRKWLAPTGRQVEFVPWTAFDLRERLLVRSAEGLRRYWFGTAEFSLTWFRDHVRLATASLDERYHPEDHVDVSAETLFQFTTRHELALDRLRSRLAAVKQAPLPEGRLREHKPKISTLTIDKADAARAALLSVASEFDLPSWQEWDATRWKRLSAELTGAVDELRRWAWDSQATLTGKEGEKAKHDIEVILHYLHKLSEAAESFETLVDGRYLVAEHDRAALIEGRAGTGKSHLLGRIADTAILEGRPVVLLLGQQLSDQPLWEQIAKRLGLGDITPDALLQALDAAAEAARKRGLILVDGVNEGPGARLWKSEIAAFLERIKRFQNLVCIISCRSEYVPYVLPDGLLSKIQRFEVRGFETAEEQVRAARVYMDKRGISRPSAPWLAPEFVNPLFLRSACIALSRDHQSEFPRGLTGTKAILAFYIRSVARNLGVGRDGSDDLVPGTIKSLLAIAARMAADRKDYISRAQAAGIANDNFSTFPSPHGQSWLDVLHRNGLLRYDPDPTAPANDPLAIPDDVVRFSFQRFQDHLMAEVLLADVSDIKVALDGKGPLAFVHDGRTLDWEWQGLVEALSIQIPELFNAELVDVLPGGVEHWWIIWQLPQAFVESVRWRDKKAFSDRTLELFNLLDGTHLHQFSLLIELSASTDHPWNAEFLHRNLSTRKLPQRDHLWTVRLNDASIKGGDAVGRLIDWCLVGQMPNVERSTQRLCGITLCWFFASSNRYIRDRATKALVSLFLSDRELFPKLSGLFEGVDDIYISERLFAAAFGSCCIDPSRHRLESYAAATFKVVFAKESTPFSLLLRDYARGIIELCAAEASLPPNIKIDRCRPPYRSSVPRLAVSEDDAKRAADRAGDGAILHSCSSVMGDFGIYEIEPRVRSFTAVPLSRRQPFSSREKFDRFEAEVIEIDPARVNAVKQLQDEYFSGINVIRIFDEDDEKKIDVADTKKWAAKVQSAENHLLGLLSHAEKRRYRKEGASWLGLSRSTQRDPPTINVSRARLWVAKRAYSIGWTKELFPSDSERYRGYSRARPYNERIGKKYQWIALDELLCRLSDNYWVGGRFGSGSKKFDNPLDVGFERDVDPTIISLSDDLDNSQKARSAWVRGADIVLEPTDESDLSAWPFLADPGTTIPSLIHRTDASGNSWVTLYDHSSTTMRYDEGKLSLHGTRQQEFRFVMCILIANCDRQKLVEFLSKKKSLDVNEWDPPEFIDGPFLREAPWRDTWTQERWRRDVWGAPKGMAISFPVYRYIWESPLDASLPEGARALIPSPWLARALSLTADKEDASIYRKATGQVAFIGTKLGDGGSCALVDARLLDCFLKANDLGCLWLFVGERNAWPGGHNDDAAWRRSEGLCWLERGRPVSVNWKKDHANGASAATLPKPAEDGVEGAANQSK